MGLLVNSSIIALPIAIFIAAIALRVAADSQPETSWSGVRRRRLFVLSYVCLFIGLLLLVATAALGQPLALAAFVLFVLASTQLFEAELKLAGSRRRAQEAELLWMLAIAVRSHRPLADEVEAYARGTWGKRHERLLQLARRLREGSTSSELAVPQGLLSRAATLEIHAGLQSGKLAEVLRIVAAKQTRQLTEEGQTLDAHAAITYPAAVFAVMVLMLTFLMYYIIPKFKKIFEDFGTELPAATIRLITLADYSVSWGILLSPMIHLPLLIFVVIAFAHYYGWRTLWLNVVGRWSVRPHAADLLRSLASTVAVDAPMDRGLDAFVTSSGPLLLQRRAAAVRNGLARGESCWDLLVEHGFLRPQEIMLIEAAQRTGNLPWALESLADNLERRWQFRLAALFELMRPCAILFLALIVGFVAYAFFLPLVKLLNDLS